MLKYHSQKELLPESSPERKMQKLESQKLKREIKMMQAKEMRRMQYEEK